ncbi:somatostatin receptor type 2 [Neodiprion pinetum]|uniref:Somatostatin receptor type 2 n=1 Tax=Neodiprion lecontei TaxID=441921 RepID=A0A6J0BIV9_NEOLC|nr:somatostatin receptor type 2 [Neodiprion lecontei]XP_046410566.1 somatostatin receptor type 2-like [Neodiprion fabricii]XP_046410567.1 somatostatin receptor type 2-like [Neodiprion fabricii]XP_046466759.1 somatostatin receptor type 2-like [Neodiprion pinetum]XP_046466760.1 somatostatin receptor type 2-like [Neodiprion pinetum]XP_046586856.1 somatostatin receptor type 2 [Neodiprion lecontei]XP_046604831.1 somatostatin receptor type 2-like [Neodiprion virginianus]
MAGSEALNSEIILNYTESLFDNLSAFNASQNDTMEPNCDADLPIVSLVTQILYATVCVVGLLGNTLVIYVVLRFSKMQTVTNMYIVNLAIADECFLIGIPFLVTTMSLQSWTFGKIMCKAYMITTSINQFTSSIFLFIMSADRYIAVCHPISSPKVRTPFISRVVSLTAWGTSALFMIPVFLYANTMETAEGVISCNILWPDNANQGGQTTFTLYTFILGFAIPLILILIFYFLVIRKLRTVGPKNKSKEKKRSHRKVTKLVLTVITVYVLCWLPYWLTQVALIYTPPKQCQSRVIITTFLLAGFLSYSNSAMNPILYAFLSDNFKKSFLKACTCAAGKDVNATLHIENSVFPRKNKANADRLQPNKATSGHSRGDLEDEEGERGLLISKAEHSTTAVTMTSRSNITVTSESRDHAQNKDSSKDSAREAVKNGTQLTLLTQV